MESVFQNVLCAINPRHPYSSGLYDAGGLAFPHGHVTVVSVFPKAPDNPDLAMFSQVSLERFVAEALPGYLRYTRGVSCVLRAGRPAEVLLQEIERTDADLICMRAASHLTLLCRTFGSVTRELLQRSRIPVLVVPKTDTEFVSLESEGPRFHFGRVVVPVDPGHVKPSQLAAAARIRKAWSGPIELLHVRTAASPAAPDQVARLVSAVGDANVDYREVVADGSVAHSIWKTLEDQPAGLLVMGLERAEKRMQPGSIAYDLVNHANAVVLAVPENLWSLAGGPAEADPATAKARAEH